MSAQGFDPIEGEGQMANGDWVSFVIKRKEAYKEEKKEKKAKELEAQAQSVRDTGLGLSKETQDKMTEFVKTNSKATLQDVIKEFFSK